MRTISSVKNNKTWFRHAEICSFVVLFVLLFGTFKNACCFEGQTYALHTPCTMPCIEI